MKNALILLLASILFTGFWSCTSEQQKRQSAIATLEAEAEGDTDASTAKILIEAYEDYTTAYPDDDTFTPRYLYREAGLQYRQGDFSKAAELLKGLLKNHGGSEVTPQAMLMLGDVYNAELKQPKAGQMALQALTLRFPESASAKTAAGQLGDTMIALEDELEALRMSIYDDSLARIDFRKADLYIQQSELYSLLLPDAESTPVILFRAGEIARSARNYEKALDLYDKLCKVYPEYEKAPQALFMQAFILDNDLKRFDEAGQLYQSFIDQYPDDDFASSAQVLLENLGKDEEEIIRNLNSKAATQPANTNQ
ncbi:MAG: tetratricopeptide repeat protein [Phaeodactylibacter sp.]|uniref:tetratricopeptide repeat protein n=1 Tax=Phaeodactylibacter sp. TaxID=1940289 RepID=UPI0032ED35F9